MNFSRISDKAMLGKFLRFPLKFIPGRMRVPMLQGSLKGMKWIVGSYIHACWLGSYEYEKRLIYEKLITEASIIFDIGAHVGFYSLLGSVLVGLRGKVFAFEPNPRSLLYLKEHLRLNNLNNVTVIEAAVSDRCGVALFDEDEGSHSSKAQISP